MHSSGISVLGIFIYLFFRRRTADHFKPLFGLHTGLVVHAGLVSVIIVRAMASVVATNSTSSSGGGSSSSGLTGQEVVLAVCVILACLIIISTLYYWAATQLLWVSVYVNIVIGENYTPDRLARNTQSAHRYSNGFPSHLCFWLRSSRS